MNPSRLLTDTCSALKLLALEKLFKPGSLPLGDLILHPRVFNETKRWDAAYKSKYKDELESMGRIRATTDLRPPDKSFQRHRMVIQRTIDEQGVSVGRADVEQLASVIHFDLKLVTNDRPFSEVAVALDVEVFTAEQILIEAVREKTVTIDEAKLALKRWETNKEKPPSRQCRKSSIPVVTVKRPQGTNRFWTSSRINPVVS
jgi:hypothetical protein